jgi:DnaJ-class molecular chaperone
VSSPLGQQNIEIVIPEGVDDGAAVRYPGVAPGGMDLVVQFRVRPEHGWERHNETVIKDMAVSIWDLVLGNDVEVETIHGTTVMVKIPAHTQPGTMLRLKSYGLRIRNRDSRGDMLLRLQARLPDSISPELLDNIRKETAK